MNTKRFSIIALLLVVGLATLVAIMFLRTRGVKFPTKLMPESQRVFEFKSTEEVKVTKSDSNINELLDMVSSDQNNIPKLIVNFTKVAPPQPDIYIYNSKFPLVTPGELPDPQSSKSVPTGIIGCTKPSVENNNVSFDFFVELEAVKSVFTQDEANLVVNNLMKRCVTYAMRGSDISEEEMVELSNKVFSEMQGKNVMTITY